VRRREERSGRDGKREEGEDQQRGSTCEMASRGRGRGGRLEDAKIKGKEERRVVKQKETRRLKQFRTETTQRGTQAVFCVFASVYLHLSQRMSCFNVCVANSLASNFLGTKFPSCLRSWEPEGRRDWRRNESRDCSWTAV
jgi:hypothetical protein